MKLDADAEVVVSSEAFEPPARDVDPAPDTVVFAVGPECDGGGTEMNPDDARDELDR